MFRLIPYAVLAASVLSTPSPAQTNQNCNTGLTRIGRKAVERAVLEHQTDACSGLKTTKFGIAIGIDDTRQLSLRHYELCEIGSVVQAAVSVHLECATGRNAMLPIIISDDLTATASADFDTCEIIDLQVTGGRQLVQSGFALAGVNDKLRDEARKQISPFCR